MGVRVRNELLRVRVGRDQESGGRVRKFVSWLGTGSEVRDEDIPTYIMGATDCIVEKGRRRDDFADLLFITVHSWHLLPISAKIKYFGLASIKIYSFFIMSNWCTERQNSPD